MKQKPFLNRIACVLIAGVALFTLTGCACDWWNNMWERDGHKGDACHKHHAKHDMGCGEDSYKHCQKKNDSCHKKCGDSAYSHSR